VRRARLIGLMLGVVVSCSAPLAAQAPPREPYVGAIVESGQLGRPLPGAVVPEPVFTRAVTRGTRTLTGVPGGRYWINWSRYAIRASLAPATGAVTGEEDIVYTNRSPDTLSQIAVHLYQNLYAAGAARRYPMEVTGGDSIRSVRVAGRSVARVDSGGYRIDGSVMWIDLARRVVPGDSVRLTIAWSLREPQVEQFNRTGQVGHHVYFIAYWFPRIAVYDDLRGWDAEQETGVGEHYDEWGDYEVALTVPTGWTVVATGTLENTSEVLQPAIRERLALAERTDSVVHVVTLADRRAHEVTPPSPAGRLDWRFRARNVQDFVWTTSDLENWDATRAVVRADSDHSGPRWTAIYALWRPQAAAWAQAAALTRFAIQHHSRYTGYPYPWPHMTAVEGGALMGDGGMEYPMVTMEGDVRAHDPADLQEGLAHEVAHMWVPMIVGSNQKRNAWIDEGTATFLDNQAQQVYYPTVNNDSISREGYLVAARAGDEAPIMRHSDLYPFGGPYYGIASYSKPAALYVALRGLLGEATFRRAFAAFIARWAFKHPTPWDFFNTFNDVAGQDLDWFWQSWYYETWVLDQAVAGVQFAGDHSVITIEDRGTVPMPVRLALEFVDGHKERRQVPVDVWLHGARRIDVRVDSAVRLKAVVIDPEQDFPDVTRSDKAWHTE
jgi:hypothetical protein